ncbi:hypothetical protein ACWD25_39735 [Streptomyces sp. NPDC002920]
MPLISAIAIGLTVAALVLVFFGLPDNWFCGLLALACMLGAGDCAYRELTGWTLTLLALGVLLAGAALHAAVRPGGKSQL